MKWIYKENKMSKIDGAIKSLTDRRDFLTRLGIGIPASVIGSEAHAAASNAPDIPSAVALSPQEVFTIYVSEALNCLPPYWSRDANSNMRQLIEAQGAALALVLAHLQQRK